MSDTVRELVSDLLENPDSRASQKRLARHLQHHPEDLPEAVESYRDHCALSVILNSHGAKGLAERTVNAIGYSTSADDFVDRVSRRVSEDAGSLVRRRRAAMRLAAAALLLLVGGLFWRHMSVSRSALATVTEVVQSAQYVRDGRTKQLAPGDQLFEGDSVNVPATAAILCVCADGTTIQFGRETDALLTGERGLLVTLRKGMVDLDVGPQRPGRPLRVITPQLEATVRGTSLGVDTTPGCRESAVRVRSGQVEVRRLADGRTLSVTGGQLVAVGADPSVPLTVRPVRAQDDPDLVHMFDARATQELLPVSGSRTAAAFKVRKPEYTKWLPEGGLRLTGPAELRAQLAVEFPTAAPPDMRGLTIEYWIRETEPERSDDPREKPGLWFVRFRYLRMGMGLSPVSPAQPGRWVHCVDTVREMPADRVSARIFRNGAAWEPTDSDRGRTKLDDSFTFTFGTPGDCKRTWTGELHFLAIHARPFTAAEAYQNFRAGVPRPEWYATDGSR